MSKLLKLCICFGLLVFVSACRGENDIRNLSSEQIYFFYQNSCPHCHEAAQYIKEKHPDLKIKGLDVKMPGNHKMFAAAVQEYKIKGLPGTPLICMGDEYIMGWGKDDASKFDSLAEKYKK